MRHGNSFFFLFRVATAAHMPTQILYKKFDLFVRKKRIRRERKTKCRERDYGMGQQKRKKEKEIEKHSSQISIKKLFVRLKGVFFYGEEQHTVGPFSDFSLCHSIENCVLENLVNREW